MKRSLFLLCLAAGLTQCGPKDSVSGPTPLVVGMELNYRPFEMRSPENEPDGISVRMAEALAEKLGRPLQIEDIGWDGLIPALRTGKIDLVISSMTRTPERAESIDFSDGYVTNGLCMLIGKDSPVERIDDLKTGTPTVAVKLSTTGHLWAMENLPEAKLTILDDAANCALEVAQGKAEAFIYDQISIYQHWKQHIETTRPILDPIREETWAIGLKKGNDELRAEVNAFLTDFRAAGKFEALAEEYMSDEKAEFERRGVPFIFH